MKMLRPQCSLVLFRSTQIKNILKSPQQSPDEAPIFRAGSTHRLPAPLRAFRTGEGRSAGRTSALAVSSGPSFSLQLLPVVFPSRVPSSAKLACLRASPIDSDAELRRFISVRHGPTPSQACWQLC